MALKKVKTKRSVNKFKIVKASAPSNWAVYLFYGDSSGMEASEIMSADEFIWKHGNGRAPVDAVGMGFMWDSDAKVGLGAEMSEYVFLLKVGEGKRTAPFNVHGRRE